MRESEEIRAAETPGAAPRDACALGAPGVAAALALQRTVGNRAATPPRRRSTPC
jgi:hypothetical protein